MAKSSKTASLQIFKKSQALLIFLLALLLVIASPSHGRFLDFPTTFEDSVAPNGRALLEINPTNKQSTTMKIHHHEEKTQNKDREFRMAAHEVPSGPNPNSNR
ncbi:hypothetical protein ACH5RR_031761 [Cinchona calisaya]|uniref:Uncharacterized protein n=1 Tax=Cinchona calisaya TaxID=153742 RepID=A0ABD2YK70_9GENT